MDLLTILLYPLIISFILSEVTRLQFASGVGIRLLDVIVGVTSLCLILNMIIKRKVLFPRRVLFPLCMLEVLFLVSLMVNISQIPLDAVVTAFLYQLRYLAYICLFSLVVCLNKKGQKKLNELLLFSGGSLVILGYIQFLFFNNLKVLFNLGWDDHLYRLFSTFLDPNFAGMFFVMFFFFFTSALFTCISSKRKKESVPFYPIFITNFLCHYLYLF